MVGQAELVRALWSEVPRAAFATGGEISIGHGMPVSLEIEGAGRIELPLSQDGLLKIRSVSQQAAYGQGEQTLVDLQVRRAWQVDATKVSCSETPHFFTQTVHNLAAAALEQIGVDPHATMLQVKLYKLLLYEQGGHFKFDRDTEKEDGMFATMIIQLPTQSGHGGGVLTVAQGNELVTFDFSNGSSRGYFQTVFFCDCNHQLEEVTSGSRLCLAFSLVRNNTKFIPADSFGPSFVLALSRVRSFLLPWANQPTPRKLAIPLAHKYSEKSLCFAGLKGYDRVVASLIRNCNDFLEVHLCMLTMFTRSNDDCDGNDTKYSVDNWITMDDEPAKFGEWDFDIRNEVLKYDSSDNSSDNSSDDSSDDSSDSNEPFDFEPDKHNFDKEGYMGNEGGTHENWYHVTVLVVWPKNRRVEVMCSSISISRPPWTGATVIGWWMHCYHRENITNLEEARRDLQEIVRFYISNKKPAAGCNYSDPVLKKRDLCRTGGKLLGLCLECGLESDALAIVRKWREEWVKEEWVNASMGYNFHIVGELSGSFVVEPKLCQNEDEAVVVAKMLCDMIRDTTVGNTQLWITTKDDWGINLLLKFCVNAGLKEEVTRIIEYLGSMISSKDLAVVLRKWPELNTMLKTVLDGKLEQLAAVAIELEAIGSHEMAAAFAKKVCAHDVEVDYGYGLRNYRLRDANVMVALLFSEENMEEAEKTALKMTSFELNNLLATLRKATGLIGLRNKEKLRGMFAKLCLLQLDGVENFKEAEAIEFLRIVFWFGDNGLLEAVEKQLSKMMWLMKVALDKDKGVVREAMSSNAASRRALKRLVEARIAYLSSKPKLEENEEQVDVFEPLMKKAKKWIALRNPRKDHLVHDLRVEEWKKNAASELPVLRQLLVDVSAVTNFF